MDGGVHAAARAPRLPAALADPSTYPLGAADLRVVETHVSWIALAGEFAYKLKRPVELSFLDYSTLPRRIESCEVELRLNRRWAPALYLDLQWLAATDTGAAFGADRSAGAEPAVRMRRFDRREELAALVVRSTVSAGELRALGERLAGWHAAAPAVDADAPWGGPGPAFAAALENFAALREPGTPIDVRRIQRLERWTRATHRALAAWFQARRAAGRVRECHGDLHTRNVVRHDGTLTPFDGIDFAPRLRWIDVASDVAFLAMDLERLGRTDLAHAFLDGWFAASGDYDAARGLPWLVAYRALVRAKVSALRARQLAPAAAATTLWRECGRFVDVAEARRCERLGHLYATTGPSGSGKTRLAAALVAALPAIHVRSDVERKRLAGLDALASSGSPPDGGLYSTARDAATDAALASAAATLLLAGYDVIVDATHLSAARRASCAEVARRVGTTLMWLECTADESVLRARVAARRGDASEATPEILTRQLARAEPLGRDERARAVTVRTDRPFDAAAVAACLRAAAARPGGWSAASAPGS
jgi:aminoglycoside phosphotransferase family enzyme/predicted kinase